MDFINFIKLYPDFSAVAAGVAFYIYFIPTIHAYNIGHLNRVAIFLLNLLLGWTFLGWCAALIWSVTKRDPEQERIQTVAKRDEIAWGMGIVAMAYGVPSAFLLYRVVFVHKAAWVGLIVLGWILGVPLLFSIVMLLAMFPGVRHLIRGIVTKWKPQNEP